MPTPKIGHKQCSWPTYFCGIPGCEDGWHQHCTVCGKRREAEDIAEQEFLKPITPRSIP